MMNPNLKTGKNQEEEEANPYQELSCRADSFGSVEKAQAVAFEFRMGPTSTALTASGVGGTVVERILIWRIIGGLIDVHAFVSMPSGPARSLEHLSISEFMCTKVPCGRSLSHLWPTELLFSLK
ncbi:unnamed protein product [Amoebophrya sp. A25]|nr:unnamed protein product [Amoebophrya sp. A25]|eukprot:GSA25T00006123001.1